MIAEEDCPPGHPDHRDSEAALASQGDRDKEARGAEGHRQQDALTWAGQRHINVMWESTQRLVAILLVCTYLLICIMVAVSQFARGEPVELQPSLAGLLGVVVGAYFNRTNHVKTGGVGVKPAESASDGR